jgi:hypothetical protein
MDVARQLDLRIAVVAASMAGSTARSRPARRTRKTPQSTKRGPSGSSEEEAATEAAQRQDLRRGKCLVVKRADKSWP